MARQVVVRGDEARIKVELAEGATAEEIRGRLPFEAAARLWGDEIYFPIPVHAEAESGARETVKVGDVAYWPPGNALCLFFGPTPASTGEEPRAASPVTVVGRIVEGLEDCGLVKPSEVLRVEAAE